MAPSAKHSRRRSGLRSALGLFCASVFISGTAAQLTQPPAKPPIGVPAPAKPPASKPPMPAPNKPPRPPIPPMVDLGVAGGGAVPISRATATTTVPPGVLFPSPSNAYSNSTFWASVVTQIKAALAVDPNRAPTLIRLAFHMCGTFDASANTGGCGYGGDSIWYMHNRPENTNLMQSLGWLDNIFFNSPPISYGDLYTLAAALALKSTGGPTVAWRAGRIDLNGADVPASGLLPDASAGVTGSGPTLAMNNAVAAASIRSKFGRMGFNDNEAVALIGAHSLGRTHMVPVSNGFLGPWTANPTRWSNDFFTGLLNRPWDPVSLVNGNLQFQSRTPGSTTPSPQPVGPNTQMRLPSDMALRFDPAFRAIATTYANSLATFNTAFAGAFGKLLELGQQGNLVTVPVTIS